MKTLTYALVALALLALAARPVAAADLAKLSGDLDGDGELETITQAPLKALFQAIDLEKDGDPDLLWTRGKPVLLCGLDTDGMPEAVIQDALLEAPWAAYAIDDIGEQKALVFVRGQVLQCVPDAPYARRPHAGIIVLDPPLYGTADIDGDGRVDIIWQDLPGSLAAAAPAGW